MKKSRFFHVTGDNGSIVVAYDQVAMVIERDPNHKGLCAMTLKTGHVVTFPPSAYEMLTKTLDEEKSA